MTLSTLAKTGLAGTVVLAAAAAYLALWPVPVRPESWTAKPSPGYVGTHAPNTRLAAIQTLSLGDATGPEHLAVGPDGKLYAAVDGGAVLRMDADGAHREVVARTGGRVLGFDFDAQGRIVAADAMRGLLRLAADGTSTVLADHVAPDDPIGYADGVVVAPDGTIYLTDASTRFAPKDFGGTFEASVLDIIEQSASGRVIAVDPATGKCRVVARGLSFANGIALASDGHTLFVNETGRYRIWRIDGHAEGLDLRHGASAQASVFLDDLPGYPDNLMRGRDGRIWVGLVKPRSPVVDGLAEKPFWRSVTLRLPRFMWPVPKPYGHVFAFDERDGHVVADLQDPGGRYPETTGATELGGKLFIHSLHATAVGWVPMP